MAKEHKIDVNKRENTGKKMRHKKRKTRPKRSKI